MISQIVSEAIPWFLKIAGIIFAMMAALHLLVVGLLIVNERTREKVGGWKRTVCDFVWVIFYLCFAYLCLRN